MIIILNGIESIKMRKKADYNERTVEYVEDELFAWKSEYKKLKKENKKLNEKIRFLEECLDRKENLNEKYRKELENYVYDAKQVRDIC